MSDASDAPELIVVARFAVPADQGAAFGEQARAAIAILAERPGFVSASIGQATDEVALRVIISRWTGIGAYRRALSNFDVKLSVIPFLSLAIDEPSAFEMVHERTPDGAMDAVSGLAADADDIGLGEAAGAWIPPVAT